MFGKTGWGPWDRLNFFDDGVQNFTKCPPPPPDYKSAVTQSGTNFVQSLYCKLPAHRKRPVVGRTYDELQNSTTQPNVVQKVEPDKSLFSRHKG